MTLYGKQNFCLSTDKQNNKKVSLPVLFNSLLNTQRWQSAVFPKQTEYVLSVFAVNHVIRSYAEWQAAAEAGREDDIR